METVPERLNRAHDLIEEAVSVLRETVADLGNAPGPDLFLAISHSRTAMRWIELRMGYEEKEHARVL